MLRVLVGITLLLTLADHWTTYLCLRSPVAGWEVSEANPIADWLFRSTGLISGLAIDTVITAAVIGFLFATSRFAHTTKVMLLSVVSVATALAVTNNMLAMDSLGILTMGRG